MLKGREAAARVSLTNPVERAPGPRIGTYILRSSLRERSQIRVVLTHRKGHAGRGMNTWQSGNGRDSLNTRPRPRLRPTETYRSRQEDAQREVISIQLQHRTMGQKQLIRRITVVETILQGS